MIRLRNDDVLVPSRGWAHPERRLAHIHRLTQLAEGRILHVPTVVVKGVRDGDKGLRDYPEAIEMMQEATEKGEMTPEVHGLRHVDYGALSEAQVREEIEEARDWVAETFNRMPRIFFTPWGSSAPHLHRVADALGLILVDTSEIIELARVCRELESGQITIQDLSGVSLFFHWWQRGTRINRICLAAQYGSWEAAKRAEPKLF